MYNTLNQLQCEYTKYSFNIQNIFLLNICKHFLVLALHMHIGKAIKNLRQLAELTQQSLADSIGKTKGLICQIEKTGKINYYTLAKIAKTLKTTPEKIEQYEQSLAISVKKTDNTPTQNKLPELEYLKMENQYLKEQVKLLKKNILLLEQKLS